MANVAKKFSDTVQQMMENDILEIDSLRQFTIPKRKSDKPDLLNRVDMGNNDAQDMLNIIRQSYKDRENYSNFVYSRPRIVHNSKLIDKFTERKKQMKLDGYSDKELQEVYGFLEFSIEHKAVNVCKDGVNIANTDIMCLGNSKMGVYLCKHADIVTPEPLRNNQNGFLVIFKMIKGRAKFMMENRSGEPLDPTPNYDCHLIKTTNIDTSSHKSLYEASQFYMYEYSDDSDLASCPSQILPMGIMNYRYQGIFRKEMNRSANSKPLLKTKRLQEKTLPLSLHTDDMPAKKVKLNNDPKLKTEPEPSMTREFIFSKDPVVWTGQLEMGNSLIGKVNLLSGHDLLSCTSLIGGHLTMMDRYSQQSIEQFYFDASLKLDTSESIVFNERSYCSGLLVPEVQSEHKFKSLVLELSRSASIGLIKLIDGTHILVLPDSSLTNQLGLPNKFSGYFLHCVFVSKESVKVIITEMLRKKFPEDVNSLKSSATNDGLDLQKSNEDTRDPRRRKVTFDVALQVNAMAPVVEKAVEKKICIVSSSRLLIMFDKMANIQDRRNIEIARNNRPHSTASSMPVKPLLPQPPVIKHHLNEMHIDAHKMELPKFNTIADVHKKEIHLAEVKPNINSNFKSSQAAMNKSLTDPRMASRDPRLANKGMPVYPNLPEKSASGTVAPESKIPVATLAEETKEDVKFVEKSVEVEKGTEVIMAGDLKLPEAVYTVVTDPRVQKLLDDLQKQNIIGTSDNSPSRLVEDTTENNNINPPQESPMETDAVYFPPENHHANNHYNQPNNYNAPYNYAPNYQHDARPPRYPNYRHDHGRNNYEAASPYDVNSHHYANASYPQQQFTPSYDAHGNNMYQQTYAQQPNQYNAYNQPHNESIVDPNVQRPEDPRIKRAAKPQISEPLLQASNLWPGTVNFGSFFNRPSISSSARPSQNLTLLPNPEDAKEM